MITVRAAKDVARQWVIEEAARLPGFSGAFYHGSINSLPEDSVLPQSSDVDVMVVVAGAGPPAQPGKFLYRGVLLEVSILHPDEVESPEHVLRTYFLASSFRYPGIIRDPTGRLSYVQAVVSREFAKRRWVRLRCEQARQRVVDRITALNGSDHLHDQVNSWWFGSGVTTHILLVAGLKNPTVRRRYAAVRELLADYGLLAFYETLLEMLGCERMPRECVELHLAAVAEAFDAARTALKTPYRFAADLTDAARPVAIDGSRELIEAGYHREAIFWMLATYSRCQWVLSLDAPADVQERFSRGYRRFLADLGINSFADLRDRCEYVMRSLPEVWEVAETIMAANAEIEPDGETVTTSDPQEPRPSGSDRG